MSTQQSHQSYPRTNNSGGSVVKWYDLDGNERTGRIPGCKYVTRSYSSERTLEVKPDVAAARGVVAIWAKGWTNSPPYLPWNEVWTQWDGWVKYGNGNATKSSIQAAIQRAQAEQQGDEQENGR